MIEQYLLSIGFKYISGCNCGGAKQRKYWNRDYPDCKIVYYPDRDLCVILRNNRRYIPFDVKFENLEKILKDYGIIA